MTYKLKSEKWSSQIKAPYHKFSRAFWIGHYQKMDWREPKMILKVGDWSRYISQPQASNSIVSFGNEPWSEDLIIFNSTWVWPKPLRPIYGHYWVFLWWLLLLKYFISKNLVWRGMLIPNFGVSTTILKPVDFFVGGTSWTLDCCKARLNYTIFMKE